MVRNSRVDLDGGGVSDLAVESHQNIQNRRIPYVAISAGLAPGEDSETGKNGR